MRKNEGEREFCKRKKTIGTGQKGRETKMILVNGEREKEIERNVNRKRERARVFFTEGR